MASVMNKIKLLMAKMVTFGVGFVKVFGTISSLKLYIILLCILNSSAFIIFIYEDGLLIGGYILHLLCNLFKSYLSEI